MAEKPTGESGGPEGPEKILDYPEPTQQSESGALEEPKQTSQPPSQGDFLISSQGGQQYDTSLELLNMPADPTKWMGRINNLDPEMAEAFCLIEATQTSLKYGFTPWSRIGYFRMLFRNSEGVNNAREQFLAAQVGKKQNPIMGAMQGMFDRVRGRGQGDGDR